MNDVTSVFLSELDRIIGRAETRVSENLKKPHNKLAAKGFAVLQRLHLLRNQVATERVGGSFR